MCTVHHYDMIVSNWIRKTNTNKPKGNYSCSYIHFFYARNRVYFFGPSVAVRKKIRCCLFGLSFFFLGRTLEISNESTSPYFPNNLSANKDDWDQHFKSQVFPYNRLIITAFAKLLFGFAIAACSLTGIVYRIPKQSHQRTHNDRTQKPKDMENRTTGRQREGYSIVFIK